MYPQEFTGSLHQREANAGARARSSGGRRLKAESPLLQSPSVGLLGRRRNAQNAVRGFKESPTPRRARRSVGVQSSGWLPSPLSRADDYILDG